MLRTIGETSQDEQGRIGKTSEIGIVFNYVLRTSRHVVTIVGKRPLAQEKRLQEFIYEILCGPPHNSSFVASCGLRRYVARFTH